MKSKEIDEIFSLVPDNKQYLKTQFIDILKSILKYCDDDNNSLIHLCYNLISSGVTIEKIIQILKDIDNKLNLGDAE